MLDLHAPVRSVLGVDVATDDRDPLQFHALPATPTVATSEGVPVLQLLRFVRDGALTGGHLSVGTHLAHPPGRLEAVREALAAELREAAVTVSPAVVRAATAELRFVGRETDGQGGTTGLIARSYGVAPALVDHPHAALLTVGLTADGVRLVEAALRSRAAPIGVVYGLEIEGLWPAQRVVARVDWGRVYDHVSSHLRSGALVALEDVQRLVEELREQRAIRIDAVRTLTPDGVGPIDDLGPALAWVQRELVEHFCEPVLELDREPARVTLGAVGELFGVGTRFAAKRRTQVERAVGEVDFQRAVVLVRTLTLQANLGDLVVGVDPSPSIVDAGADHPFFARFSLHLRPAIPLESVHLSELVAEVAYGSAQLGAARLTPEAPEATLETWADASPDGTWTIQPSATFASDAPLEPGVHLLLDRISGDVRAWTFDVEAMLGLRRLDVSVAPDERVAATRATLRRLRGAEQRDVRDLVLTAEAPAQLAWFRDHRAGDRIELTTEHFLRDGRVVRHAPVAVDTSVVRVPPAYVDALSVHLVTDDDWGDVVAMAVALQKVGSDRTGTVVLEGPGASAVVNLDLPDPVDRRFRYRATRTRRGGVVEEDDWVETDVPVVLLGQRPASLLVVELQPLGPELPTAGVLLVEVALQYVDPPNQVLVQETKVVRALADRPRWEVELADPARRTYEYRITTHRTSGASQVGPWTASSDRLLVVPITTA